MKALSYTEFTKTGELAKILKCSNQTVTNTMTLLHCRGLVEMEWTTGGAVGTRQWKRIKGKTFEMKPGRTYGRLEEIFISIKKECKYVAADACTYRDNKICDSEHCPMIIRR